jgi:glycine betaine/choline ABC-type transport system substrate-binding protein
MRLAALAALLATLLSACAVTQPPVRIGAKSFDEQRILAAMIARVLNDRGLRTSIVHCGDTYGCQQALREGRIDVMVEYTGTAMALSGLDELPGEGRETRIRAFYESIGLRWHVPLGFHNDYAIVVSTARAASLGLDSISDLSRMEGGIRVATHPVHARRPVDGLYPFLRRYGLQLSEPPLLLEHPNDRYNALLSEEADAAVAFTTDGFLTGRQLRTLDDTLDFFPHYAAAIVVSERALERHRGLGDGLQRLTERVDTESMRRMNAEVQLEGRKPEHVAAEFLQREGMIETPTRRMASGPELMLVHSASDRLGTHMTRAVDTVRRVFPDRHLNQKAVVDPVNELIEGRARLALLSTDRFFPREPGGTVSREERIEAVSVIGVRLIHIVARRRAPAAESPLAGRVGVFPLGSSAARISEDVLAMLNYAPTVHAEPETLFAQVADGTLDAAILLAGISDPEIAEALAANPELTLEPLPAAKLQALETVRIPYLRNARLPARTYAGQENAVETASVQIVLAAPAQMEGVRTLVGGLTSALRAGGVPLSPGEARTLLDAGLAGEMPDPVLPTPWSLKPHPGVSRTAEAGALLETLLNLGAWTFLGLLLALLLHSLARQRYS